MWRVGWGRAVAEGVAEIGMIGEEVVVVEDDLMIVVDTGVVEEGGDATNTALGVMTTVLAVVVVVDTAETGMMTTIIVVVVVDIVTTVAAVHAVVVVALDIAGAAVAEALEMTRTIAPPAMSTALPIEEVGTLTRIEIVVWNALNVGMGVDQMMGVVL